MVALKPEYQNNFKGKIDVTISAATGIKRDVNDWGNILKNNRYDSETFSVTFVKTKDCEGNGPDMNE